MKVLNTGDISPNTRGMVDEQFTARVADELQYCRTTYNIWNACRVHFTSMLQGQIQEQLKEIMVREMDG